MKFLEVERYWVLSTNSALKITTTCICLSVYRRAEDGSCIFGGWARMSLPLMGFSVVEVRGYSEKFS